VQKLKRSPSGVGRLYLADGSETPVSRRIMPKVRSSFE
jgi:DNA-binding LytR/AlgR family response regulator